MVAAVVHVFKRVAVDGPLESLDVLRVLADAKDHVQMRSDDEELGENRVLVVAIDFLEIAFRTARFGSDPATAGGDVPSANWYIAKTSLSVISVFKPKWTL